MTAAAAELATIEKAFFGVPVLRRVSLRVEPSRTVGLVGENGAGKSTLMNILGGNLLPDAGHMTLYGKPYAPRWPRDAEAAGVAFIHQELNLFPNLSIAENLFLTRFPRRFGRIDRRTLHRRATELLERVGLELAPDVRVEQLSAGERQIVEIAKALSLDARLMILDEPTTSLTARERDRLFELLRSLQQRGIAMIYISHALGDVRALCHDVVVLRDGCVVGQGPAEQFDTRRLVSLMVGRETDQQFPERHDRPPGDVVLHVRDVTQPGVVGDVTFDVRAGQIVGLSGLMGSGRTELARILFGLDPMTSGRIELDGVSIERLSSRQRVRRGMALVTESRRDDGLCMQASVRDNVAMAAAWRFAGRIGGMIHRRELADAARRVLADLRISGLTDERLPVRILSGGNQQKVVLAKWLLCRPRVLILDEPTRGIDVGSRFEIHGLIQQLAEWGAAVLLISSDLDELIGICDRILVMRQGRLRDALERDRFDPHRIMRASLRDDSASTGGA